jgi:GT2 family glycosyltransferase
MSVIIPVKDEAKNLERLLPALLEQTSRQEVIVAIAPSTTDPSREVAQQYTPLVRWVEGGMPAAGRNAGAKAASGEYLFFLDADVLPGTNRFLEKAERHMRERALGVATVRNYGLDPRLRDRAFFAIYNSVVHAGTLFGKEYAMGTCIIARRDAHERCGGFDEGIAFAEDTEYVQRLAHNGHRFGLLPDTEFIYADTRRLRRDGVLRVLYNGVKADLHRTRRGEIKNLSFIDDKYFEHTVQHSG